ncbi:MAG: hypothetical protein Tp125SUR00d2C35697761_32 [Prokaryotic dsDNA virus sp.]|nr:MAG: hypothetical protein Tp125SUR00d2C35697761_32 [Prokaryotic dsDNA virus sp.]QDP66038.1 MAG: hypothetical protein Unbinned4336contig1000_3 [Prokaryotic dsDNA virus sp.]
MKRNLTSREYTGNTTLPANQNRGYFYIVFTTGTGTVEFNKGGGLVPIASGEHYEPYVAPIGEISVVTTGTFVVIEG